jgi:hypothetical protein
MASGKLKIRLLRLSAEVGAIDVDRQAKHVVIARLNRALKAVHADRLGKDEVIARFRQVACCRAGSKHAQSFGDKGMLPPHDKPLTQMTTVAEQKFIGRITVDSLLTTIKIDVFLQGFPVDDKLSLPLHKQATLVPDLQYELYREFFNAETSAACRRPASCRN